MGLISLKCPECHGDIQLDDAKEFGFCMHCGTKVLLKETIKQNLNITLDDNRIANSESIFNFALNLWIQSDYHKASANVEEFLKVQPDSMKGWILYWVINKRNCEKALLSTLKFDSEADFPVLKKILLKDASVFELYKQCFYNQPEVIRSLAPSYEVKTTPLPAKKRNIHISSDNLSNGFENVVDSIICELESNNNTDFDYLEECRSIKSSIVYDQEICFEHIPKRGLPVAHYLNGLQCSADSLSEGIVKMNLGVGMHRFTYEKKKKSLYIPIPAIPLVKCLYYSCNLDMCESNLEFKHWYSGVDTMKICSFRLAAPFDDWTVTVEIKDLKQFE